MKPFSYFFKIVFLLSFCFYNIGCQSGLVSIQIAKTGTNPSFKSPPVGEPFADKQGTSSSSLTSGDNTVFFVSVVTNLDLIPTAIGLNFLSSNSNVAYPFGFHLASARSFDDFSWNPVVIEGASRISWIELPPKLGMPHLKVLDPGTLLTLDRGEVFNAINWSISSDAEWVTGVQVDGKSMLQNMISGMTFPFFTKDLSKESKSFQLSSRKQGAILDPLAHRIDLFSFFEPAKVLKSWSSSIFAVSPSGGHLVIVDSHGMQIIETDSGNTIPISGEVTNLRFPQWKNDEALAFVSGPLNRSQIQVLDLKTGQLNPIAFLAASSKEEILVCPAWVKSDLFYADRTGENSWSIWKVDDPISKRSTPKLFVQPLDSGKGYVCPKGITG